MTRPVAIAVAGYGLVGRRHVEAIARACGAALAGVVEPGPAAADARAEGLPVWPDLDAAIASGAAQAVILATPNALHVDGARACISAGLPALVEKPLAIDASAGAALVAEAEAAGVPLGVGHHRRHDPIVAAASQALRADAIGDVRAVQATCWLAKPDAYFDAAPWRTRAGAGPGSVNLIHDLDLLRYLVGEVASVQAQAIPSRRGHAPEDLLTALLRFDGGALGTVTVSDAIAAPWSWELTAGENPAYPRTDQSAYLIGGTEGSLSLPDLRVWRHGDAPDWMTPIGATTLLRDRADALVAQVEDLARVVRTGDAPLVSGLEGLRTLRLLEAIQAAAAGGGTVAVSRDRP